jgi:hypothetical protein
MGFRGCYEEDDPDTSRVREGYLAGVCSTMTGSARRAVSASTPAPPKANGTPPR